ncbi:MAG: sirohydrochlorin cobaltochelatase [Methanotrichaceae archaeon]
MKKILIGMAIMLAIAMAIPSSLAIEYQRPAAGQTAILLAFFGTSHPEAFAGINNTIRIYKAEFPDKKIAVCFTSEFIRTAIKERHNITYDNALTALAKLNDEGYTNVVVQAIDVINGEEYDLVKDIVDTYKGMNGLLAFQNLTLGAPLMTSEQDYIDLTKALAHQMDNYTVGVDRTPHYSPIDHNVTASIYMGHGTPHYSNSAYSELNAFLARSYKNTWVGTVEGYPTYDDVLAELKASGVKQVRLAPLMISAGEHALVDLTGTASEHGGAALSQPSPDSWRAKLMKEGFNVTYDLRGLAENDQIVQIWVRHTKAALNQFTVRTPAVEYENEG